MTKWDNKRVVRGLLLPNRFQFENEDLKATKRYFSIFVRKRKRKKSYQAYYKNRCNKRPDKVVCEGNPAATETKSIYYRTNLLQYIGVAIARQTYVHPKDKGCA